MTDDRKDQPSQGGSPPPSRQPIFLLPPAVAAICGLLIIVWLAELFVLNDDGRFELNYWLGFWPIRLIAWADLPGGWLPMLWTPVTHAFLHGGWSHVIINTAWLAIFGAPVASRYGGLKFVLLFVFGAIAGAAAFALTSTFTPAWLIGASGGVAALTGAAIRFMFQPPVVEVDPDTGERRFLGRRLATFTEVWRHPTARFFTLMWIILNAGVPLAALFANVEFQVAWQAHLGGFVFGFFVVPLLERKAHE